MAGQRHDGLHRALAERLGAHHDRAIVILQRAGHDLRRRGRAAVDQHDHRAASTRSPRRRVEALDAVGAAAAGRHDLAAVEEDVGDRDRLLEQAAGVVAQVEHHALEAWPELGRQLVDRVAQAGLGLLVERGHADVADVASARAAHRRDRDHRPRHADVERHPRGQAGAASARSRCRPAAHPLDRLGEGHAEHRLAVDVGDDVAGLDAGAEGRRIVDRRHHLDQAVLHRDLDAQTAELAFGLDLHVAVFLGVEIAGMRVERGQHAVDRRLDQHLVGDLLDVFGSHPLEHVAEQLQLPEGVRGAGLRHPPAARDTATTTRPTANRLVTLFRINL